MSVRALKLNYPQILNTTVAAPLSPPFTFTIVAPPLLPSLRSPLPSLHHLFCRRQPSPSLHRLFCRYHPDCCNPIMVNVKGTFSGTLVNGADVVKVVTDIAYITDVAPVFHVLTHSQEKWTRTCGNIQKPEVINSSLIYRVRALVCAPSNSALDKIVLILLRPGVGDENDPIYTS
uniref:Probable helicase MAGATAMA 3 n=1 Tax=Tanacetum cinerariifolium TaxID=118510 RepID=A0A6L2NHT3_TANCI|nr:probable helicase MAGATAMA 3 [Tanacetum cinerariifolium]